jgi:hypothetical protein
MTHQARVNNPLETPYDSVVDEPQPSKLSWFRVNKLYIIIPPTIYYNPSLKDKKICVGKNPL